MPSDVSPAEAPASHPVGPRSGPAVWTWTLLVVALVAFAAVLVRTAWIGDDAFITLRTVDNFTQGHGLRWNVAERVQTYTHPLWMLLLSVVYAPTRNPLLTFYLLSFVCTAGALAILVFGLARSALAAALAVGCLVTSKGFMEFSTSGLENPLSHLLIGITLWNGFRMEREPDRAAERFRWCALAAGLAVLNRFDLALLVAPLMVWGWVRLGLWPGLRALLLGYGPLGLWLLFALVYYGSPLPITAYAKLNHGIASGELWANGLRHLGFMAGFDPASGLLVLAGGVLGLRVSGAARWATLGALLYVLYLVKIGGDFMGTRFFAAPVWVSVCVLARSGGLAGSCRLPRARRWVGSAVLGALVVVSLAIPERSHLLSGGDWGHDRATMGSDPIALEQLRAGADERFAYYRNWGLISVARQAPVPAFATDSVFPSLGMEGIPVFSVEGRIGERGYLAGPQVHFIDYWLCDPLLMRLPMLNPENWRIGHFTRRVPEGYLESLTQGGNRIGDPGLKAVWGDVAAVTRGGIFSGARLNALWRLWTGHHDGAIASYAVGGYRQPPVRNVAAADVAIPLDRVRPWFLWDRPMMSGGGTRVGFPGPVQCAQLQLGLAQNCTYTVAFTKGDQVLASRPAAAPLGPAGELSGFSEVLLKVPPEASRGFDSVLVRPRTRMLTHHRLGWLIPVR